MPEVVIRNNNVTVYVTQPSTLETVKVIQGPAGPQGDAGVVQSVVAGANVTVDATDPANPVVSAATPVVDHGALTGLADDDHPQYHTDARGDTRYYTKAQVDTSLAGKSDTSHAHDDRYVNVLNVLDYGAVGNGVADDTVAIQAAIDAAGARGGTVYFPAGLYLTTATLNGRSYVSLLGDSFQGSVIKCLTASVVMLRFSDDDISSVTITNLGFEGDGSSTVGLEVGATTEITSRIHLSGVQFYNHSAGVNAASTYGLYDCLFESVHFYNCTSYGVLVAGSQATFVSCKFQDCGWGLSLYKQSAGSLGGGRFYGCTFVSNSYDIVLNATELRQFTFEGCWFEGAATATVGTAVAATKLQGMKFSNCTFQPSATSGLEGVTALPANSVTGRLAFEDCVVFTDLYASATIPDGTYAAPTAGSCLYSRKGCMTYNGTAFTVLTDATKT